MVELIINSKIVTRAKAQGMALALKANKALLSNLEWISTQVMTVLMNMKSKQKKKKLTNLIQVTRMNNNSIFKLIKIICNNNINNNMKEHSSKQDHIIMMLIKVKASLHQVIHLILARTFNLTLEIKVSFKETVNTLILAIYFRICLQW